MSREDLLSLPAAERTKANKLLNEARYGAIDEHCKSDILYWLQNRTATNNPQYAKLGLPYKSPFPKRSYFIPLFAAFEKWERLFVPKTRDMMTSWCAMGFSAHRAQWFCEETI